MLTLEIVHSGVYSYSRQAFQSKGLIQSRYFSDEKPNELHQFEDDTIPMDLIDFQVWRCRQTLSNHDIARRIVLPEDYYIPSLAYQDGLVARTFIRQGCIVAEYGGLYVLESEFKAFFDGRSYAENYAVELFTNPAFFLCGHFDKKQLAASVNDWRPFPDQPRDSPKNFNHLHKYNLRMETVLVWGFPRVFLRALRNIEVGEDLLTDYGDCFFVRS